MKPEHIDLETAQFLSYRLRNIDSSFNQIGEQAPITTERNLSTAMLEYRGRAFLLGGNFSSKLSVVYIPEDLTPADTSRIKRFLKFKHILNHIAKIRGIESLDTAIYETIDCFNVYYTLNNLLNYGDMDHSTRVIFDIVNRTLYLKKHDLLDLLSKPSRDYEMPPRFMMLRTFLDLGVSSLTDMMKIGNIHHFMFATNHYTIRDILPLHELLEVSEEDAANLEDDLYELRQLLQIIVGNDPDASLCVRTPKVTYKYIIATGEERILDSPYVPIYYTYPNVVNIRPFFNPQDLDRILGSPSIFSIRPTNYRDINAMRSSMYRFNCDVDIRNPQPKPPLDITMQDLDDGFVKTYKWVAERNTPI